MFELSFPFAVRGQIAGAPKIAPVKGNPWQRAGFTFDVDVPQATLGVKLINQHTRRVYIATEGNLADSIADCELMVNERLQVIVADIDSYAYTRETNRQSVRPSSMMKYTIIGFRSLTRTELWGVASGNDKLVPALLPDLNSVSPAA